MSGLQHVMSSTTRVDRILRKLYTIQNAEPKYQAKLSEQDLLWLVQESVPILKCDPTLLKLDPPIMVCGDLHGQFFDLLTYIKLSNFPDMRFLFLGDYVDRGPNSIETFSLLLALKIKYPQSIFLLRGNHETVEISRQHGLFAECASRFNIELWNQFTNTFKYLSLAAVISDKIFCVHGGITSNIHDISEISEIKKPIIIPERGILHDLLWADPLNQDMYDPPVRDSTCVFTPDVVDSFLKKNNFELIVRGHQVAEQGYSFPFSTHNVITIFSAPGYNEQNNKGSILSIDEELCCSFLFLEPIKKKAPKTIFSPPHTTF